MLLNILIIVFLILLTPTTYAAIIGAPLAITPKTRVEEIIKAIDIKQNDRFYELGAGTGKVMKIIAKHTRAHISGFELSPILYVIAWSNLKINRIHNSKLYFKNFFKANLKEADIVFFFLMPKAIERLKAKLEKDLKPKTKVVSFAFEIKGWKPYLIIKDNKKLPVYFYKV